jgi:murein DD-endopeptidase MepM/ murein hydrolase activator NlpD
MAQNHPALGQTTAPSEGRLYVARNFGLLDLNERAISLSLGKNHNPYLDPKKCAEMVSDFHHELGIKWSFGGYLEDRSNLWRDSYLEHSKKFLHLGIDVNLPAGTPVASAIPLEVIMTDDDHDLDGGWGPRIIAIAQDDPSRLVIFAHLADVLVTAGDRISPDVPFAVVGAAPLNGNWYPHYHIQQLNTERIPNLIFDSKQRKIVSGLDEIDGYGRQEDYRLLSQQYEDPIDFIPFALYGT